MRLHIHLDDRLIAELDERVGPRNRSAYITAIIARTMDDQRRWDAIQAAVATVNPVGEWRPKAKAKAPKKPAPRKAKRHR